MIYCLEGPDRCGKTTLLEGVAAARRNLCIVPGLPTIPAEHRQSATMWVDSLWDSLYDSRRSYITDRFHAITSSVYDLYYRRPQVDYSRWRNRVTVLYVDCDLQCLLSRPRDAEFDPQGYADILACYATVLSAWRTIRVKSLDDVLAAIPI